MLYDTKWDQQAVDLSMTSLIAWLEQQPPEATYPYGDAQNCLLAKWLQSMDPKAQARSIDGSFVYSFRGEKVFLNEFQPIAISKVGNTYGAALERARSL